MARRVSFCEKLPGHTRRLIRLRTFKLSPFALKIGHSFLYIKHVSNEVNLLDPPVPPGHSHVDLAAPHSWARGDAAERRSDVLEPCVAHGPKFRGNFGR